MSRYLSYASAVFSTSTGISTSVIDLQKRVLGAIYMTTAWTAADISFAGAAATSQTFHPLFNDTGLEITVTTTASRLVALTGTIGDAIAACRYIKLRSGTSTAPVSQTTGRTLILMLKG